jgi:hypothetical protein
MKKLLWLPLLAALALSATAVAANGKETHFGPFASTSTDNGSCSQPWANDTFNREFKVKDNGDGTFGVREEFKQGSFVTIGGVSPGACDNTNTPHGSTVVSGINGTFEGYLEGTVTSATFDPNGCDALLADCTTTDGFLAAVFGASGPATFTCNLGYAGCTFNFNYAAGDQGLRYHHWQDSSGNGPNQPDETFRGDIANA